MPNKNSQSSSEDETLQARVDAMMSPETASKPADETPAPAPIDIFEDTPQPPVTPTTAPVVPGQPTIDNTPANETVDQAAEKTATTPEPTEAPFSDPETGQAVDDIAANEADAILAAEDAAARPSVVVGGSTGWRAKLGHLLRNKWTWVGLVLLLAVLLGVPVTRYKLLGLIVKKPVTVNVIDSKTATPVSNAVVKLGKTTFKTDANGKAALKIAVGRHTLNISKQYYKTASTAVFIGFKTPAPTQVHLVATGRQVPITVVNKISGKPLANAEIKVLGTTAKTSAHGQAVIVLPTTATADNATVQLASYNTAAVKVQVTSSVVSANTFQLTPNGHLYFLSNLNGTIDVVKTNLDGSNRQTVLAGTGKEAPNSTSLLASRDWRYLVLKAQRDGDRPGLYLIDTSNDKMTSFDNSNATFNLIGWYGHNFMYDLVGNATPQSQTGHEVIKSYDADHLQLNQLDQDQAEGNTASYAYQGFGNFYILDNELTYTTQWYTYDSTGHGYDISSKTDTIRAVQPNGSNKKDYQSFPTSGLGYIQAVLYKPQSIYYAVYNNSNNTTTYYNFDNLTISSASNANQSTFAQSYPTYLISPSGNQTFWTDQRDGKNVLFTGDDNAQNQKQIGTGYAPYGWYSDSYVLVSQNNSQLYIMPATGLVSGKQPLVVSNYYKPPQTYNGYGYGYGGL